MAARAVLRLQRGAGNAAVSAMLARRTLARNGPKEEGDAKAPARDLPDGFAWMGTSNAPVMVVNRAWLLRFVPGGTTLIKGSDYPDLMRPVITKLLDLYPWAKPQQAEILGRVGEAEIRIGTGQWEMEQFEVPLEHTIFGVIGALPPDAPIQVYRAHGGIDVYVDTRTLAGGAKEMTEAAAKALAPQVVAAVEENVSLPVLEAARPRVLAYLTGDLTGAVGLKQMGWDKPEKLFGEKEWREQLDKTDAEEQRAGAVITSRSGTSMKFSQDMSLEDMEFVAKMMQKLFGDVQVTSGAPAQALTIFPDDVPKLRELAQDPKRLERLREMLKAGKKPGGEGFRSFAHVIETIDEALEMKDAAKLFDVDLPDGDSDEEPIVRRPVHGTIMNTTGELVPTQQGRFVFFTNDNVDVFRVPMVWIKWIAINDVGREIDSERTKYIEVRPDGVLNDRDFKVKFDKTGVYEIHAFVYHNFFLPAHFEIPVEVRTEKERLAHLDKQSGFGKQNGGAKSHRFGDVDNEEVSFVDQMGAPPLVLELAGKDQKSYAAGRRSEGEIDPDLLAMEGGSVEVGIRVVNSKIEELERMRDNPDVPGGRFSKDELKWIGERLERLRKIRDKFTGVRKDDSAHPIHCQGSYVARTNKVQTGPLTLISWFTYDAATKTYSAQLMDHSELVRAETFTFKAKGDNYERVMERLFFELTKTYPDGSMTFAFQQYKGLEPTGQYVRFERVTDTKLNDARDFWNSEETSFIINLLSVLLTVFPPTMALGITIGLVYNTAQAIDQYQEAERTGTLKTEHKVALGLAVLDVIPALGRASKLVRLGRRTFFVIDALQYAGQSFLIATTMKGEIENIRDLKLTALAKKMDEITRRRRVNASDPEVRRLEGEAEMLRDEVRGASGTVFREMGGSFMLQMAPTLVVNKIAAAHAADTHVDVDPTTGHPSDPGGKPDAPTVPVKPDAPTVPAKPDAPTQTPKPDGPRAPVDDQAPGPRRPDKLPDPITPRPAPADPKAPAPKVSKDPGLAEGLPEHLRGEVEILRDDSLHDDTVRVEYVLQDGLVTEVKVRAGRAATVADVALHAHTAGLMLGYRGLSGRLRVLFERYKAYIVGGGTPPPVGSLAWEAKLEMDKLPRIIRTRMERLAGGPDAATAARLEAEIEYLTAQLDRHSETFDRLDFEAGSGKVAAEGGHHAAAVKSGYPSLDDAPGHYYLPDGAGGFELHQRPNSGDPPMQLVDRNGRRVLEKAPAHQAIPGVDLPESAMGKLRKAMADENLSGADVQAVAQWLGADALAELASAKSASGLRRAVQAHQRVAPLLSDPEAVAGLARLMQGSGAAKPMGVEKRLRVLEGVPGENLRDFLRWVGREEWQHPHAMGDKRLLKVGNATDELKFMTRYGQETYHELSKPRGLFERLMERLRGLDDAAADGLVKEMIEAGSPVPREKVLGMPKRPPARRRTTHGRADTKDPKWNGYLERARAFLNGKSDSGPGARKEHLRPDKDGVVDFEAAVEAYATVTQVSERVTTRWEQHQKLSYDQRLRILQDLDDAAAAGGLPYTWINNLRGDVGEALFAPGGGRRQTSIPNPDHPAKSGAPGRSQLDGVYEPAGTKGQRPGSTSPVREWVEVKTDLIDYPGKNGRPNSRAVQTAHAYAEGGLQDLDALRRNPGTENDRLVIRFARKPADKATEAAMLEILHGPDSPFSSVGFGDVWHDRPSGNKLPLPIEERRAAEAAAAAASPAPGVLVPN